MSADAGRSQVAYARLAGAMFLAVDALDALELAVAGRLRVPGDIVATAQRITQSEVLYRAAVSGAILAALFTVLIGVGLYGALKPVDRTLALTGLVFRTAEGVLFGVQGIVVLAFLRLYTGLAGSGFSPDQLSTLVAMRSSTYRSRARPPSSWSTRAASRCWRPRPASSRETPPPASACWTSAARAATTCWSWRGWPA